MSTITTKEKQLKEESCGKSLPDKSGHFGKYGGRFVPETLMPALEQLEREYLKAKDDSKFNDELKY